MSDISSNIVSSRVAIPVDAPIREASPQGHLSVSTVVGGGAVRDGITVDTGNSSPLATLQTTSGRPIDAFSARPSDLVTVLGVQTTVATAIHLGVLQRHPATGALVETGMTGAQLVGATPGGTPADDQQQEVQQAPLSRQATNFQSLLRDAVPGTELSSAYADYIERGSLPQTMVNRIASHLMITPVQAYDRLSEFADALDDQRARTMARYGITDLEQFDAWAVQTKPEAVKRARALQLTHGNLEGFKALAQTYFENLDTIDPERVLTADFGAGIRVRMSGGKALLSIPGVGEMSYKVAVSQGIVRVR